jgi:hypothetical protein
MDYLKTVIDNAAAMGAASVLETLGLTSGEISQRRARDTYGKWFLDATARGRLRPCRVEDGRTGTRWYRVVDILALKTRDAARAELNERTLKHNAQ